MAEHRTLRKNTEGRVGIYTCQALEEMQIRTLDDHVSQREGPQTAQVTLHWRLTLLSFPSAALLPQLKSSVGTTRCSRWDVLRSCPKQVPEISYDSALVCMKAND